MENRIHETVESHERFAAGERLPRHLQIGGDAFWEGE
jgi:hypothetical protein